VTESDAVGGDLNETRSSLDRRRVNTQTYKPRRRFIDEFLDDSKGIDVWRTLYPKISGFTYEAPSGSKSRRLFSMFPVSNGNA